MMTRIAPSLSMMVLGLLLASALALALAVFGSTSERSISVRPAEAASAVGVTVACYGNPEITRVKNNTNHRITIRSVGSIYQPRSNEPFHMSQTLSAGSSVAFESGYDANHNTLTRQYIYNNDVGGKEGARVSTSVGRFSDHCG
jgi:hypothetical protein